MNLIPEEKLQSESLKQFRIVNGQLDASFRNGARFAENELQNQIQKRFYWLKPDGTISNMWDEKTHNLYLTKEEIEKAEIDGWHLIQINVI